MKKCNNCGESKSSWEPSIVNPSGVQSGRLMIHDLKIAYVRGGSGL